MKNVEAIKTMTTEELVLFFCNEIMDSVAKKADKDVCDLCPVAKKCQKGKNGFRAWLEDDVSPEGVSLENE